MEPENEYTIGEAIEWLENHIGQSYVHIEPAFEYAAAFWEHVTDEFCGDEHEDIPGHALSAALRDKSKFPDEARGVVIAWPHEPVVTIEDVSSTLVEATGGEPSKRSMAGGGFTLDARHEENLEYLTEKFD